MQAILSLAASPAIVVGLLSINLLFLLLFIVLFSRTSRLRKTLTRMFTGTSGENMEGSLLHLLDEMEEWKKKQTDLQFTLNRLSQKLSSQSGNLAIIRYNAFGDIGSDLSFSLALLDETQNGVVITSIYGREESRTYAKPIEGGKSPYNLSEEELSAIKMASTKSK